MELPYPPAPNHVPLELARPSRKFRIQAWAAMAGLALFLVFYFGLTAWFGWFGWQQLKGLGRHNQGLLDIIAPLALLFLFAVMVKGIFFVRRGSAEGLVECSETEEPTLFEFVRRIAAEVGAPRPHRVFLSARVNAAVFYDLTLLSLLFPSRKNLEVGLGAVNALSLDEFKAVIAHEFGHFAQKTMTVGRWVHTAQQFVLHLIVRRDMFDRFLDGLSRFDLRVAWIGWILRLVVWSVRSVLETMFRGVVALERALARQMEFQADLAAVRISGSDSIVHGLRKLEAADDAWGRAARFAIGEAQNGRQVVDMFAIQSKIVENLREVLGDPALGITPDVPAANPDRNRVFTSGIAQVPAMWASHPPNHEREENTKRIYVPSALDSRPAWLLFSDPARVKSELTRKLLEANVEATLPEMVPIEDSLQRIQSQFVRPSLERRFRGAYLGRELTRHAQTSSCLYRTDMALGREETIALIERLYPESLAVDLGSLRDLSEQAAALKGLNQGFLDAPGKTIRFRGREVRRKDLPDLIAEVEQEHGELDERIRIHDQCVRMAHLHAARLLGERWEKHLLGLACLLHYAEHTLARLEEARGYLAHIFRLAVADGKVTKHELERLQDLGLDVLRILREIHDDRGEVTLPAAVCSESPAATWASFLPEKLELQSASAQDIAQGWLAALDSYAQVYSGALNMLRSRSLDALLAAEDCVGQHLLRSEDLGPAPETPRAPDSYACLLAGLERPRVEKLGWWQRFLIADGLGPSAARFAAAAAVLAPTLLFSWTGGDGSNAGTIAVHNGLGLPVVVSIDRSTRTVGPHGTARISHHLGHVQVRADTADGREIERFEAEIGEDGTTVYNVAGASAMVEATATYGNRSAVKPRFLGAARWFETNADHVFEDPPETYPISGGGAMLAVLQDLDAEVPWRQVYAAEHPLQKQEIVLNHCRWDPLGHADLAVWMEMASQQPGFEEILRSRLKEPASGSMSVELRRLVMDHASLSERSELCAGYTKEDRLHPGSADLDYLSIRCMESGPESDAAFLAAQERSPAHIWLRWASYLTLSGRGDFAEALKMIEPLMSADAARRSMLGDHAALEVIRLRRLLAERPQRADVKAALVWVPWVEMWLESEKWATLSDIVPPNLRASWHLQQGHLAKAQSTAGLTDAEGASLTTRIALSEGASPEQVRAGLQLPLTRLDTPYEMWPVLALMRRENGDTSPIRQALDAQHQFDAAVWDALDTKRLGKDPSLLDAAVIGLTQEPRGYVRWAGIVLLGDKAPMAWRREAQALLLPNQRGYIRLPKDTAANPVAGGTAR